MNILPFIGLLAAVSTVGSCFSVDRPLSVNQWQTTRRSHQLHEYANSMVRPQVSRGLRERDISAEEDFINLRNQICAYNNSELFERYSNIIPMTVNILREEYGARETWWGDLSAAQTRTLYQRLLPRVVLIADEFKEMPLKDKAYIASMARYAAKLYARERSMVPERAAANLYDGARYFSRTGKLSWTGPTVDEIWLKYENDLRREYGYACDEGFREQARRSPFWEGKMNWEWVRPPGLSYWPPNGFWRNPGADDRESSSIAARPATQSDECPVDASRKAKPDIPEEELYRRLYERVLKKSCTTDPFIDRIALGANRGFPKPSFLSALPEEGAEDEESDEEEST